MTFGNYVGYPPRVNGDLVWTGTGGLSDTQTYRWIILNAIHDTLAATSLFSGFVCKRIVNALPIEAFSQVPFLGVYSPRMELGPDGDFNASDIRFTHHVPIGIQVIVKNNDPVAMMKKLDECEQFIMNQLWRDDALTNLWRTPLPDGTRIEGIASGLVEERWFTANLAGARSTVTEMPLGEKRMEFVLFYRSDWAPTEFADLHRITSRTAYPRGGTPEEQLEVQQVTMVYEFDATTGDAVPFPLPDDTDPPPNPFP